MSNYWPLDNCYELFKKWKLDSIWFNKCKSKGLLLNAIIPFLIPFLSEIIFYIQNQELALNLSWFVVWGLFAFFFLFWYLVIKYLKYKDGTFLVWFILTIMLYIICFYIYFNFEWY
jgi:membrane-bound metal-dependent hydrolase YbcI (DUF457 family)